MPATFIHSFAPRVVSGGATPAWRYDPADTDAALTAWATANIPTSGDPLSGDYAVDRTGGTPRLTWRHFELQYDPASGGYNRVPTGTGDGVDLVEAQLYIGWTQYPQPWRVAAADTVVGGFWESDQYGRPYDITDLLAGS